MLGEVAVIQESTVADNKTRQTTPPGHEHLAHVLDHVGGYVYTKDIEGRYTYVNRAVCELVGATAAEILGQTDDAFFDLSQSDTLRINDQHVMARGERVEAEEKNYIAATGEIRYFWSVKIPLRDDNGRVIGMSGISTDVTEQRNMRRQMEQQAKLLDTVLNNADAYIYMKDFDRRYLYANKNTAALVGLPQDDLIGKTDAELFSPEDAERFAQLDRDILQTGQKAHGEETFVQTNGGIRHYWSIKIPLVHDGQSAYVGISTDITEVIRLRNKYEELANKDSLTGILSRGFLLESARQEMKRAERNQQPLTVMIIDVDHFKRINDSLGHAGGDRALIAVVNAFQDTVRDADLLGRLGGDEFAIIAANTRPDEAEQMAIRLQESVKPIDLGDQARQPLTLSMGIATFNQEESLDELFARADRALYKVKQSGRNGFKLG